MKAESGEGGERVERGSDRERISFHEAWRRARRMLAGVERGRVDGSGVELAYLDWGGDGDVALLHHANGFCAATLAPVAVALRDRYRVVSLDGRGHGDSTSIAPGGEPDPYAWPTLADDLLRAIPQILARTGRAQIALAIGHSFGGHLMLRAATRRPDLLERLVLFDPVLLPPPRPGEARRHGGVLAAATRRRRDRFPSREAAYSHCRSRDLFAAFTPEALALYVGEGMRETSSGEVVLKCDREVEAAIFDGGARSGPIESLDRIRSEVLFVHAGRGNFSRAFYEQIAGKIPRSRIESLDVGHLFPMEQPEEAIAVVTRSLARTGLDR